MADDEKPKSANDWVKEAYRVFIKEASECEPTDPIKAIRLYYERNASDELKARAKEEGKTIEGAWKFVTGVARLIGGSCHIDPATVYAMVMHYFQDVPAFGDFEKGVADRERKENDARRAAEEAEKRKAAEAKKEAERAKREARENPMGLDIERTEAEPERKQPAKPKKKARRSSIHQGFFFEAMIDGEEASDADEGAD